MNDSPFPRHRLLLCAALYTMTGLAGIASLAFAPAIATATLPVRSAAETLRAVAASPRMPQQAAASAALAQPGHRST
jgi:hypothetical protein